MDYGQALEFGYFLIPDASDASGVLETASLGSQSQSTRPNRHLDLVVEPLTNRDDDLASGVSGLDISDRRSGLDQRVGSIDD